MQDLKHLLEQEHQHTLEVRETLLMTIAMLGVHICSQSAQLLMLAILIGRLDDLDPGIRCYAAELLLGKVAVVLSLVGIPQRKVCTRLCFMRTVQASDTQPVLYTGSLAAKTICEVRFP